MLISTTEADVKISLYPRKLRTEHFQETSDCIWAFDVAQGSSLLWGSFCGSVKGKRGVEKSLDGFLGTSLAVFF